MGHPTVAIFGSASSEVITTFYIPRKAPQHLNITCIFVFKLFFQFLNSWWVFTNEVVRFEEEIALAVICVFWMILYRNNPNSGSSQNCPSQYCNKCCPHSYIGISPRSKLYMSPTPPGNKEG